MISPVHVHYLSLIVIVRNFKMRIKRIHNTFVSLTNNWSNTIIKGKTCTVLNHTSLLYYLTSGEYPHTIRFRF